jgi:MFS family permease
VSYAFLSYPAGVISDRVPRRLVFATGLGIFSAAYIGLGAVTSSGWVWLLLPLYGGYAALTDGVGKAWVTDLLPGERVGTGLGLYQGLAGGAALIAGIWAGLSWGSDGRLPLLVSGVAVAGLAAVLFLGGTRLERGSTEKAADAGNIAASP